ncbi:MAG: helix-turn-helix transcriptional regulator [Eubacterium sp.]|nr:helix-turn-helix transcriptional regulator [Eubacterium sp.]MBQ6362489.1 helix-turn-helix transcriptional regulator [Lachnospiraceae bacterium]
MTKEEQEEYLRQVGYRLGHLRLEKNVSGQEIADRIGKSKSVVSKIENGGYRITMDVLLAYSDVLQIPLSDLITIEDLTPALARYMPDLSPRFQQLAVSLLNCLWEEYTGRSASLLDESNTNGRRRGASKKAATGESDNENHADGRFVVIDMQKISPAEAKALLHTNSRMSIYAKALAKRGLLPNDIQQSDASDES